MDDVLFRAEQLTVKFKVQDAHVQAVDHLDVSLRKKHVLCLLGETGCGKSVFASTILRILPDNGVVEGKLFFEGQEITALSDKEFRRLRCKGIFAVPQNPSTSLNPLMRCAKQVDEVTLLTDESATKEKAREHTISLFRELGLPRLPQLGEDYPFELSGGMRQRVLVAMGMAPNPKFLLIDEPTKGLDWVRKREVIDRIRYLRGKYDSSMLLITHDFSVAEALADEIAVMYAGEIVEYGKRDEVIQNARHPFTKGLISALPRNGFQAIRGYSPPLTDLPDGCRFHPRCPIAKEACRKTHPSLEISGETHVARCPYA